MFNISEQENTVSAREEAIKIVYPLYARKYPGDVHSYPTEYLKQQMRLVIWTQLLQYIDTPEFSEKHIFNFMDYVHKKIHRKPPPGYQPELPTVPQTSPDYPQKIG